MALADANVTEPASLLDDAENAIVCVNRLINGCAQETNELGSKVKSIALKTIDVLFSIPTQKDTDKQRRKVIKEYSTVLCDYSKSMNQTLSSLNRSWMELDQALGFYLMSAGHDMDTNPKEIGHLIDAMTDARNNIPDAKYVTSYLSTSIKDSAGGLTGLEDAIAESGRTLERLTGELNLGDAVLQRQIILAERLQQMLSQE